MKVSEFIQKLQNVVDNYNTLYVMGCFGAPLTGGNVSYYCKNHPYNKRSGRTAMIRAAGNKKPPVYGFDCVNLIKGILWGWNGDSSKTYGGAKYAANGVPDIGADAMITKCSGISTDFTNMIPGEAVWLKGHIGIYIGNGKVIECSPAFQNCVQRTACLNIGAIPGMNGRRWTKHGRLPYITYDTVSGSEVNPSSSAKEDENMTQEQFNKYMAAYRKGLQDNDCGNWSQEAREWAIQTGLLSGGTPLPDGSPNYMWADFLTREQAAQLFYRFSQIMKT